MALTSLSLLSVVDHNNNSLTIITQFASVHWLITDKSVKNWNRQIKNRKIKRLSDNCIMYGLQMNSTCVTVPELRECNGFIFWENGSLWTRAAHSSRLCAFGQKDDECPVSDSSLSWAPTVPGVAGDWRCLNRRSAPGRIQTWPAAQPSAARVGGSKVPSHSMCQ